MDLKSYIREVPDFPKPGINFKDITPLLKDPEALATSIKDLAEPFKNHEIDLVAGIESRGFMFGIGVARELNVGFIPIRKKGKLPAATISQEYQLEYGTDSLEIHKDAIRKGQKVLIIDDLLATGGTMKATANLVESSGGTVVSCAFVIELEFLNGKDMLANYKVKSLIKY